MNKIGKSLLVASPYQSLCASAERKSALVLTCHIASKLIDRSPFWDSLGPIADLKVFANLKSRKPTGVGLAGDEKDE